jgi:hypothetical protein
LSGNGNENRAFAPFLLLHFHEAWTGLGNGEVLSGIALERKEEKTVKENPFIHDKPISIRQK